jgi:3-methyladenine DNA glycosylase AlkD
MNSDQIIKELKALADPKKAQHSKRFFKSGSGEYGEGDKFLGIKVPEQRKVAKKHRDLSADEIQRLLQSEYHEIRLTALFLMVYKVDNNLEAVNNWDLVDSSAHQILGRYLEDTDKDLLFDLARSNDLWKKRIAMISCYHFIKQNDFKDALNIAEILVHDEHDLIQKAVGWMLREIGNRDLATEESFLKKHYQNMPQTMLRYAIEKFEEPLRLKYLHGEV